MERTAGRIQGGSKGSPSSKCSSRGRASVGQPALCAALCTVWPNVGPVIDIHRSSRCIVVEVVILVVGRQDFWCCQEHNGLVIRLADWICWEWGAMVPAHSSGKVAVAGCAAGDIASATCVVVVITHQDGNHINLGALHTARIWSSWVREARHVL